MYSQWTIGFSLPARRHLCIEITLDYFIVFYLLQATSLDATAKEVKFEDGESIKYDKVFFATGGR